MRVVIKQEAKQIAVDARKVDLHVQTCVIVYYVKIMTWMEDKDNVFEEEADD